MPVARYQLPDGRVARFEVPEGTSPEQAQQIGMDYFAQQSATTPQTNAETAVQPEITQAPMSGPRDIKPYGSMSEFVSAQRNAPVDTRIPQAGNLANEAAAGASRPIAAMVDFFGIDRVNDVLRGLGVESQIPTASAQIPAQGTFDPSGLGKVASAIGSGVTTGGIAGAGLRGAAGMLNPQNLSTGAQVLRNVAATTPAADVITGGMSGAGTVPGRAIGGDVGESVGEYIGGESGAQRGRAIGEQVGEFTGGAVLSAPYADAKLGAVRERFDPKGILTDADGLPKPEFAKALKKRGIDYGAVVDDVGRLQQAKSWQTPDDAADNIIKTQLKAGNKNSYLYKYELKGDQVVDHSLGEKAVKQGWGKDHVTLAKQSSEDTRGEMLRMLEMQRQIAANPNKRIEQRPSDIAGERVMDSFRYVRKQADRLRSQLDQIVAKEAQTSYRMIGSAPGQIKGRAIDTSRIEAKFREELEAINVEIPVNLPKGVTIADYIMDKSNKAFDGSDIMEDQSAQRIIRRVANLLSHPGQHDALRAHNIKKQIDKLVVYQDASTMKMTPTGEGFAKAIRRELNQVVRDISPEYRDVNDQLSAAIGALTGLKDDIGPSVRLFDPRSESAIGSKMKGFMSNQQGRNKLINAVREVDEVAAMLGKKNNVSIDDLVLFSDALETKWPTFASNSLQGTINKTDIQNVFRPTEFAIGKIAEKSAQGLERMRNINDTEAFNTMHKLLRGK